MSFAAITSSPGLSNFITASVAATPLLKARPCLPFSIVASASSSAFLVGFWLRAYSKPLFTPGASCTYVLV